MRLSIIENKSFLLLIVAIFITTTIVEGFQWMSKLKMPKYDANQELVEEKFGDRKLAVITGASSGLGRKAALALLRSGEYHVIGAVRDLDKMEAVAEIDGFDLDHFTPMKCELNSFESVHEFCEHVNDFRLTKPIDRLICNAGVYQPSLEYAKWSKDNHEQTMQINFLSHFLMTSKFLPAMTDSTDPRVIMVGSVTGNDNTVGGGGVYPIADLHELEGFEKGFTNPIAMADGYGFIGAKAYKDSKLCLMMTANYLHYKYNKLTGVTFSSMYPGCIAESPLFREKRAWFRTYFPIFMKFITGGFVGEHEAGQRLFQVAHDPRCSKSGVYWSWNGGPREGRGAEALEKEGQISGGGGAGGGWDSIFENDQSSKVLNLETATTLFETATKITNADWPAAKQITSPCPTLKVIGAVTQGMVKREELKRMREMGRPGMTTTPTTTTASSTTIVEQQPQDGRNQVEIPETAVVKENINPPTKKKTETTPQQERPKLSKRKRVVMYADRAVGFVLGNTIGRVGRLIGGKLLGEIPEEAKTGSYHPPTSSSGQEEEKQSLPSDNGPDGIELLEEAIAVQLKEDNIAVSSSDEVLFESLYEKEGETRDVATEIR
jgi:protochlorophyllide reductase